ncbi:hypothetical protein ACB445_004653 [Citrobacter amalonaticus]
MTALIVDTLISSLVSAWCFFSGVGIIFLLRYKHKGVRFSQVLKPQLHAVSIVLEAMVWGTLATCAVAFVLSRIF